MSQVLRLSVLASALLPLMATAQTEKSPTNNNHSLTNSHHNVMTVYATGNERDSFNTPMMVTVIKNDSPETKTANNANDILRKVPGIALTGTSRTNGQDISMRGFDRRGILTLVDGIRQGTDTGHINGTFLDPALIKQVEIIRGPSALLYGSGAMGGVIAWETVNAKDLLREGQNQGFRVFTQGATGDHSFGFGGSAFGKTDDFDGLFSFVTKESGDVRLGGGEKMDNKETIANMLGKGTWQLDDAQTLSGQIRYYNNDAYEPKDPQQLATSNDNKQVNRTTRQRDLQATYQLNPDDNSWLNLKATPYYSDVNITSKGKESNYEGRSQKTYGIKLDNRSDIYELPLAAHNFTYGTEAYRQKQTPYAGTTQFPDAEITFASGFIQDEITLKDLPVSFILGTRYDNYKSSAKGNKDVKEDQWSSKAAVSITPTEWSMLFASYSEAFRAPTMMEMYNDSLHFKGGPISNYWRPNPDLKPESTRTAEYGFGLRFDDLLMARDNLRFKASYFDTKAKDYINTYVNTDRVNWNNNYTTSINTKRAKIWGTDVSLDYTTDYFAWGLAYNHTVGVNEYTGKSIESIKPDSLTSNLSIPVADSGFSVGWLGEFTTHTDFDKTSKLKQQPGYAVHDFYLNYQGDGSLKGLDTSVVLGNAFDKEYYSSQGIPQDGRNAKLLVSFNGNSHYIKEKPVNSALFERYQQAKADNKAKYARDLAAYLNVSEGELLHSRVGRDKAKRLNVDAPTLLTALEAVGPIKAITRNEYVVHEQVGRYENAKFSPHGGLILNPRALDLRMFFSHWDSAFVLTEEAKHGERHSIQFFDKHGDALHKVYTTDETDMDAWNALIEKYMTTENPQLTIEKVQPHHAQPISDELKQQLDQEWRNMTDVHQFFILLKKNNLSRQQVFHAVSDDLAWQVPNDSFNQLVNTAFADQNEIMIFVGNRGCVQIFTGKIKRLMPLQTEGSDIKWLNIFNPDFTLHMIENGVAECWVTRKPTEDGFVTSLEVFDDQGNQIAQMYGQRTEGTPEQEHWRQQVMSLPRI